MGRYWLLQPGERLHGVNLRCDVEGICTEKAESKLMHAVNLNSLLPGIYSLYLNYINFWLSILRAWQTNGSSNCCVSLSLKETCKSISKQIHKLHKKKAVFFQQPLHCTFLTGFCTTFHINNATATKRPCRHLISECWGHTATGPILCKHSSKCASAPGSCHWRLLEVQVRLILK